MSFLVFKLLYEVQGCCWCTSSMLLGNGVILDNQHHSMNSPCKVRWYHGSLMYKRLLAARPSASVNGIEIGVWKFTHNYGTEESFCFSYLLKRYQKISEYNYNFMDVWTLFTQLFLWHRQTLCQLLVEAFMDKQIYFL